MEAQLLDISPLGVRIQQALPYEPADLVEFSFLLPGDRRETRLQGEVVWLDFSQTARGYYTMGVSLLHPHWRLGQMAQG